jgi:hypothetical protein
MEHHQQPVRVMLLLDLRWVLLHCQLQSTQYVLSLHPVILLHQQLLQLLLSR